MRDRWIADRVTWTRATDDSEETRAGGVDRSVHRRKYTRAHVRRRIPRIFRAGAARYKTRKLHAQWSRATDGGGEGWKDKEWREGDGRRRARGNCGRATIPSNDSEWLGARRIAGVMPIRGESCDDPRRARARRYRHLVARVRGPPQITTDASRASYAIRADPAHSLSLALGSSHCVARSRARACGADKVIRPESLSPFIEERARSQSNFYIYRNTEAFSRAIVYRLSKRAALRDGNEFRENPRGAADSRAERLTRARARFATNRSEKSTR